jgi:hypothetical protein
MQVSVNIHRSGMDGRNDGTASENGSQRIWGMKTLGYTSKTVTKKNANETSRKTDNGRISNEEKEKINK